LNDPVDLGVDGSGRAYVLNANDGRACETINVYSDKASGDVAPIAEIGGASTEFCGREAGKLSVARDGRVFVTIPRNDAVLSFDPGSDGNVPPSSQLRGQVHALLHEPFSIAVFSDNELFVGNRGSWPGEDLEQGSHAVATYGKELRPDVRFFDTRDGDPTPISTMEVNAFALGASPTGWGIAIPAASASDQSAPRAEIDLFSSGSAGLDKRKTIAGESTGLVAPIAVTADTPGRVYVLDDRCRSRDFPAALDAAVLVFAPGSAGDVKPQNVITGSRTGMACP
jgi:hypothetical protein